MLDFTLERASAPLIGRLGFASLELLVLAALVALGIRLLKPRSPRAVALLWLMVMIKPLVSLAAGPLMPALAFDLPMAEPRVTARFVRYGQCASLSDPTCLPPEPVSEGASSGPAAPGATVPFRMELLRFLLSFRGQAVLWAVGASFFTLLTIWDRLRLRSILAAAKPAPPRVRREYESAAERLGLRHPPRLRVTEVLESPALAGHLVPVVLLPAWLAEEGTEEQLRWALSHELMHWKMKDPWAGMVRNLLRILFFFHPVAWWAGRRWEVAAELACDQALVASPDEATSYAERLFEILEKANGRRRAALASGLFATRTQIRQRIATLLALSPERWPRRLSRGAALGLAAFTLVVLAAGAESRAYGPGSIEAEVELRNGDVLRGLRAQGRIAFSLGGFAVRSIEPGGFVVLTETGAGPDRRLEIRPGPQGGLDRVYTVGGERRPFEAEARAFETQVLPTLSGTLKGSDWPEHEENVQ